MKRISYSNMMIEMKANWESSHGVFVYHYKCYSFYAVQPDRNFLTFRKAICYDLQIRRRVIGYETNSTKSSVNEFFVKFKHLTRNLSILFASSVSEVRWQGRVVLVLSMKAYSGSRGTAPFIRNLGNRWSCTRGMAHSLKFWARHWWLLIIWCVKIFKKYIGLWATLKYS